MIFRKIWPQSAFSGGTVLKNPPVNTGDTETQFRHRSCRFVEEEMATHSDILISGKFTDRGAWQAKFVGLRRAGTWRSDWVHTGPDSSQAFRVKRNHQCTVLGWDKPVTVKGAHILELKGRQISRESLYELYALYCSEGCYFSQKLGKNYLVNIMELTVKIKVRSKAFKPCGYVIRTTVKNLGY